MAARPPKPPQNTINIKEKANNEIDLCKISTKTELNCSCTNISIMQLFHEMKQNFPTIPDHVVNQCVLENCHNRDNCEEILKLEADIQPYLAQTYPSHVLCNNKSNLIIKRTSLIPIRPAPLKPLLKNDIDKTAIKSNNLDVLFNKENLNYVPPIKTDTNLNIFNQQNQQIKNKPSRPAPPPPTNTQKYINNKTNTYYNHGNISDSGESGEISVNISVSPSTEKTTNNKAKCISTILVKPETSYLYNDITVQNPRSFTSVNLTLRKPGIIPQSPIDISVSQGLTYSSSSYNPQRGYQKNFYITVTDDGGTISTSRIRSNNDINLVKHKLNQNESNLSTKENIDKSLVGSSQQSENIKDNSFKDHKIVQRQRIKQQKLLRALENNRKITKQIKKEIKLLLAPHTIRNSVELGNEILQLRYNCAQLCQRLEKAKNTSFKTNPELLMTNKTATINKSNTMEYGNSKNLEDGQQQWVCTMCTFQNHPLLNKCEFCENIRIDSGTINNLSLEFENNNLFEIENNMCDFNRSIFDRLLCLKL